MKTLIAPVPARLQVSAAGGRGPHQLRARMATQKLVMSSRFSEGATGRNLNGCHLRHTHTHTRAARSFLHPGVCTLNVLGLQHSRAHPLAPLSGSRV